MFGGATSYAETLDWILDFVSEHQPTEDELIGWHRGTFDRVSSRASITRRIDYLENVGFLELREGRWVLGPEGRTYFEDGSIQTLLEIMCRRNVGLRSLLYTLSPGPMTIEDINRQQLETHPELGWDPANMDMAKQRANWLRSLGLVRKDGSLYELTDKGREFTEQAVDRWADSSRPRVTEESNPLTASTYETTVQARSIDPEFRATVLSRYDSTCPVSEVDHRGLLDVAHILS